MTRAPRIELDDELAEPGDEAAAILHVIRGATETIGALAEQRWLKSFRIRGSRERRIRKLGRAIDAAAPHAWTIAFDITKRAREDGDAWALWAACYVLGRSSAPEAIEHLDALVSTLETHDEIKIAGEALALHSTTVQRALNWAAGPSVPARALALEVARHVGREELGPGKLQEALLAGEPLVVAAALRALASSNRALEAQLLELLTHADAEVVDLAGRALLRAGNQAPVVALRDRDDLRALLGSRAAEWIVLGGTSSDVELLTDVSRGRPTTALVSALGRVGTPLVWSFLSHFVADPFLGDTAQAALTTLFGEIVPLEQRDESNAWRVAVAARRWDPTVRFRRGEPWSVRTVIAECLSEEMSAYEIALRVDELAARLGVAIVPLDFGRFDHVDKHVLERLLTPLETAPHRAGAWSR